MPHGDVSPETRQSGANQQALAGMIPTGVEDAIGPAAKMAILIGPKALDFPSLFTKAATEDIAAGKPVKEVWRQWGQEPGADNKMVSEISDRGTQVVPPPAPFSFPKADPNQPELPLNAERASPLNTATPPPRTLEEGFPHPKLYKNYPEAAKVEFESGHAPQVKGGYVRAEQLPGGGEFGEGRIKAFSPKTDPQDPFSVRGTTVHEAQHKVQQIEDMPRGGTSASWACTSSAKSW